MHVFDERVCDDAPSEKIVSGENTPFEDRSAERRATRGQWALCPGGTVDKPIGGHSGTRPTYRTNPVRVDMQVRLGAPDTQRLLQILDYVFTLSDFHLNQIRPTRNSF